METEVTFGNKDPGAKMSRPRYYTPKEVAAHNAPGDCWVSYLGKVYDLTSLCKEHTGEQGKSVTLYMLKDSEITSHVHGFGRRCAFEAHSF